MREQYLAQIQNGFCEGNWLNAKTMFTTESRYCKTKEEAQEWIDKAVKEGIKSAKHGHHLGTPPFSLYTEPDEKNLVTKTRIKKRLVSEWEEV